MPPMPGTGSRRRSSPRCGTRTTANGRPPTPWWLVTASWSFHKAKPGTERFRALQRGKPNILLGLRPLRLGLGALLMGAGEGGAQVDDRPSGA